MTRDAGQRPGDPTGEETAIRSKDTLVSDWRIVEAMGRKRIRTVKDLAGRLEAAGLKMSTPNLSRIVRKMPDYLSVELLKALLCVLECDMDDLIRFRHVPVEDEAAAPPESAAVASAEAKKSEIREPKPARVPRKKCTVDPTRSLFASMPDDGDGDAGENE